MIVLVVFCIELIVLNWGNDSKEQKPQLSVVTHKGNVDKKDEPEISDNEPTGSTDSTDNTGSPAVAGDNENEILQEEGYQLSTGKQYLLPMLDNVHTLSLVASEELFDFSEQEDSWFFIYKIDRKASMEVCFRIKPPEESILDCTKGFLELYLEGGDATAKGEGQICNSTLVGAHVSGSKGDDTYEAWMQSPLDGTDRGRSLLFVINYQTVEQREALYTIIDTLEMYNDEALAAEILAEGIPDGE
jgi:hypothetical protein